MVIIIGGLLDLILGIAEKNLFMIITGITVGIIFPFFRFILISNAKNKEN